MLVFFVSSFLPGLFSSGLMHLLLQTRISSLPAASFLTQKVFKTNFTNTPCDFKNELRRNFKSIWITGACQYTGYNSRMSKSKSRCNILHCIATLSRSVLLKSKGCPLLSTKWDVTEWYCRRLEVVVHRFFSK